MSYEDSQFFINSKKKKIVLFKIKLVKARTIIKKVQ